MTLVNEISRYKWAQNVPNRNKSILGYISDSVMFNEEGMLIIRQKF